MRNSTPRRELGIETTSVNGFFFPSRGMNAEAPITQLGEYSDSKRLAVYKMLIAACGHMYSKGKLQEEKFNAATAIFADLAKNDPLFLAHFTVWAMNQDGKDQKVLAVFFNSLSDADGLPFFPGSDLNKPNFRQISSILLQNMDVPLAIRVAELAQKKFGVKGLLNESRHFTTSLKTAFGKYVLYREAHQDMLSGIRNAGLTQKFKKLYKAVGIAPSDYAVGKFKWNQRDGRKWQDFQKQEEALPDFAKLTSAQIAEFLGTVKLSPVVALSVIPQKKITASVAEALVKRCTGNQSIVLYNWFASNGFLDVKAIRDLFESKVKTATTAVDRIDTLTRNAVSEDKAMMSDVRSANRKAKADTGKLGKIYMHIDISGSMNSVIAYAKDNASIFAECIDDPAKNFAWGTFNTIGRRLSTPTSFKKEGFHAALYGISADGGTDCFANYADAREFGANIDVFITDEDHTCADLSGRIRDYHTRHPNAVKPSAVVIIRFGHHDMVAKAYENNGIPVVVMTPESLKESALVSQSVAIAMKGEMSVIEDIMKTEFPSLPKWWSSVGKAKNEHVKSIQTV
jgi:hypothetical protein